MLDNHNGSDVVLIVATITLKDIPQTVHLALKRRARRNSRSLNKEALACLEQATTPQIVDVNALLREIQEHRRSLPGRLSDRLIKAALRHDPDWAVPLLYRYELRVLPGIAGDF